MLNDIGLEVHNIECLLKKARTLGVISRLEDVHKNRKNSILIGKIDKIYPLIEESDLCNRNQLKLVLKEVYPDGTYGHHFLTVFFNEIAVEIDSAKFNIGDKLLFVEPQVFPYAPHRPNKALHNLHVQIGLSDKLSPTLWFARKYSQEMARRHGRQNKSSKIRTTSKGTAAAPVSNLKKPQVPSSVITDVTKNETRRIETLDVGKQSLDELDKTSSDCFVVLEDIIVSSPKKQISDNENNNNKQTTQLKIGAELQSENSSKSVKNEVAHVNELIVDEQYFDTVCKENTVIMCKNIQETNTGGQQEKKCETKKKSTIKSRKSISSTEKGAKTMKESSHISLGQKSASVASLDDKATEENNNTKQQSIILTDDTTVLQSATPNKIQKSTSSTEKGAKTMRKSSHISLGEKSAASLDDKITKENNTKQQSVTLTDHTIVLQNATPSKIQKSTSSTEKGAKTMRKSSHISLGEKSAASLDDKITKENNTKQQSVTLTDHTIVLQNATPSKIQVSTPTKRIINKEISKLGTPSTGNLGTPSTSNLGTPSTSNLETPSTSKSGVSSEFIPIGPDEYDVKLFMDVSIVLNDIGLNKYNGFLNHNNNQGGNDDINSVNKVNRSSASSSQVSRIPPTLKRLSAESDESEGGTIDKSSRSPPKLKKHVTFSSQLSIESEDSDQGAASDSTVDLEGLLISKKRGFVRLSKTNKEKQIKKSSPSNESVLATNRKTINEVYNMKTETKKGNYNKDQQNATTVKPSSSPLKSSDNMKRKLFSPEKMEYLLSGEEQEQFSSVLSMFDEYKDSIKGISLDHSYSILSKDSSVQNTISDIRRDAENNDKNSDNNNSATTAVVNHDNEVVNHVLANTLNKQTESITKQYSFKDNNGTGENSNSVVKMIDNSGSSERVNYKNDGTTTTITVTTSTSPVISTRPPKPRQTLIKSQSHGAAVTAPSYNDVNLDYEIYTAGMKRKSITSASSNTKFRKMVRIDYTMPRRKRSSVLKPPAQMETEDDIHNGNKAVTETHTTVDSVKHQYYDGSCDLSIVSGFLVDLHPHVLGTMDLIIGHCMMPCGVHRYSDLIWIKNEENEEPRCPACFKLGSSRKVHLMFMFNITVMATDGNLHNILVFEQHAEHFLGCSVRDYIESKAKRILIRDTIESYMVSATSGSPSAPKIRFCICNSNGIKILMKDVTTSSIEHV